MPTTADIDPFAVVDQHIAAAKTRLTCKRRVTLKLLTSCENLQSSSTQDVDLETLQNYYAIHLALCELDDAYPKLRAKCSLQLPDYAEDATTLLRNGAKEQFRQCIHVIKTNENWWTSYSNNRRDTYSWCKAMGPGFDEGMPSGVSLSCH